MTLFSFPWLTSPAKSCVLSLLCLAPLLLASSPADARWARKSDAQAILETESLDYFVDPSGTYVLTAERRFRITRDEARSRIGTQRLAYNSRSSKLEVLEARTILPDGRRLEVPRDQIQDKPLASSRQGFDQLNQILVAFPEAEVGAVLELKTRLTVTEIPFENYFSTSWLPGASEWTEKSRIRIQSQLPLHFAENDPNSTMQVKLSRDRLTLQAQLTRPGWQRTVEEAESWLTPSQIARLDVATTTNPTEMVRSAAPRWEAIASSKLPGRWRPILEEAKRRKTLEDRLDTITSGLAGEVHYWADWRPIRGGHVPRELETIAATRFGDCKDFAVSTIAMARALGFEANPVFIERGTKPLRDHLELPVTGAFNHAIARIRDTESGRTFFIDPTNRASFAHGIFDDIADRPVLVMLPDGARLERTPAMSPAASLARITVRITPRSTDSREEGIRSEVNQLLTGSLAAVWTGEELERSRELIEYDVARTFATDSRLREWKFKPFSLKDRVVRELRFDYTTLEEGAELRTNAGLAHALPQSGPVRRILAASSKDRAGAIWLGQPARIERELILKPAHLVGGDSGLAELKCELKSRWLEASRDLQAADRSREVRATDRIQLLRPFVAIDEIRSREFQDFTKHLRKCFDRAALVLTSGTHVGR
jgi:transglutaminase-like putative cysteine protease